MRFTTAIVLIMLSVDVNNYANAQASFSAGDLDRYSYVAPEGWRVSRRVDHILIEQSHTDEPGCIILIFPLQPSSGSLEKDALNVFNQMYGGWQFRHTGEKQFEVAKGLTLQNQEFCRMAASMSKLSFDGTRYEGFEDGVALVLKAGQQIVVIAARHTTTMAHVDCMNKYGTWKRFFNSFTVKDVAAISSRGRCISQDCWRLENG